MLDRCDIMTYSYRPEFTCRKNAQLSNHSHAKSNRSDFRANHFFVTDDNTIRHCPRGYAGKYPQIYVLPIESLNVIWHFSHKIIYLIYSFNCKMLMTLTDYRLCSWCWLLVSLNILLWFFLLLSEIVYSKFSTYSTLKTGINRPD